MILYRYDSWYSVDGVHLSLSEHEVDKETACGYWIGGEFNKRWVSKTSRKRWAYPTPEEALDSFRMRKQRQIEILNSQIMKSKDALEAAMNCEAPDEKTITSSKVFIGFDFGHGE